MMKVKTLVVASAIGLMLLGFSLYECHLLPSTFSLKEAVAAGDVSPSQPEGLPSKTSERLYPSKQDFGAIKSLNGERRPLPMCEEEALSRIEKGLSRAHNSGIGFVPLKISNLSEAENHLIDKEVFIGYPKFTYGVEVDEWFVFSGYTHAIEEKVRKEKHAATFSYGWAVRKEDGKIVRWDEPPPTFVEDDADLISPIPEGHR